MPLQPRKLIVKTVHGSHLYGTSTPTSDNDYKGIHLPSGESILVGEADDHCDYSVKISDGIKNDAQDVDFTSYSLRKWLNMLADGDSFATEILFANQDFIVEQNEDWETIRAEASRLLSRKCSGFVAFCQRQAANYGVKGSRMDTCNDAISLLEGALESLPGTPRLKDIADDLHAFADGHEHCSIVQLPTPQGGLLDHLQVLERKLPFTVKIADALPVLKNVYKQYGSRAQQARANKNVDWKSLAHAIRVGNQALELMTTGKITFPRPEAAELLSIRLGQRPFEEVAVALENLVNEIERVSATSHLPEKPDRSIVNEIVLRYHLKQVTGPVSG